MRLTFIFMAYLLASYFVVSAESKPLLDSMRDSPGEMVLIQGGGYTPLYKEDGQVRQIEVDAFYMDQYQVTNQQYLAYTETHSKWQKQNISPIFADQRYLSHLDPATANAHANQPVTHVSWYAAMSYCKAQGKTLPSVDQWEFAAQASANRPKGTESAEFKRKILDWYARSSTAALPQVHQTEVNYWGVHGMHGVVWEQVSDFNSTLVTGESRGDSALDKQLYCGSGAAQSVDAGDYAAFMRYALRSSYSADYTLATMGFRCAKSVSKME